MASSGDQALAWLEAAFAALAGYVFGPSPLLSGLELNRQLGLGAVTKKPQILWVFSDPG
jgi:hypothetical protein